MSIFVFIGPTLSVSEASAELDAVYLPPVAQGDVYRVARLNPRAIGIVDGYFQRVPAVWHKEILWAMTQGVHVFGSASMGALRAAELESFGMEGVGAIFEAYRSGLLTDDDEVAVTHASAEAGYALQSEAMVNVRATLAAAEADGVLRPATRAAVERIAKDLFYPDRTYALILRRAVAQTGPAAELEALRAWLPGGRVDQKQADAIAMLRRMRARLAADPAPQRATFRLEQTLQWQRAQRSGGAIGAAVEDPAAGVRLRPLLDELGLAGDAYIDAHQATLLSYLALREAEYDGYEVETAEIEQMRAQFCQTRALQEPRDLDRWLRENGLTAERLMALLREEALRSRLAESVEPEIVSQLPDHLRLVDAYRGLLARAQHKQRALEARGLQQAGLDELGLSEEALVQWHFARLRRPLPSDIETYARAHGFESAATFARALAREHSFVQTVEAVEPAPSPFAALARGLLADLRRSEAPGSADPGEA
jgi:hypothetical protein